MAKCLHSGCDRKNRLWLPTNDFYGGDIKLHPWCIHCGVIKNISDDTAHRLGYWINILSKISDRFSLKQVQKRLIAKELTNHELFSDIYGVTGCAQKELFIKILRKYSGIILYDIDSYIY